MGRTGKAPYHPHFPDDATEAQPALQEAESPQGLSQAVLGEGVVGAKRPLPVSPSPSKLRGAGRESQRRRRTRAALQRGAGAPVFGTPSPTAVAAAAVGTQVRSALWGVGGSHQQRCPFPSLVQPPFLSPSWDSSRGPAGPCPSRASFQGPSPLLCLCCPLLSQAWL